MLNSKKIISTALALLLTVVSSVPVNAAQTHQQAAGAYALKPGDSINWNYIASVAADFTLSGNNGKCKGSYKLCNNIDSEITVKLMKASDNVNWSPVESWSESNNTCIPNSLIKTSTNELDHGYYYCTFTLVQVKNSKGMTVETGNIFSNSIYYP